MDFKFNKLYNIIIEDVKSSKIKAKKVIKQEREKIGEGTKYNIIRNTILNYSEKDWAKFGYKYIDKINAVRILDNIWLREETILYDDFYSEEDLIKAIEEVVKNYANKWNSAQQNNKDNYIEDQDDQDDNDYPTITVGNLRKELQKADPDEIIWFSWNTYSDGGEDCCGFDYNEDSKTFYLNQFTHISEDEEQEEEPNYDYAPSAEEVLDAIKDIPDDVKVFGYWDENEGTRYCISKIKGTHIELDGKTEC